MVDPVYRPNLVRALLKAPYLPYTNLHRSDSLESPRLPGRYFQIYFICKNCNFGMDICAFQFSIVPVKRLLRRPLVSGVMRQVEARKKPPMRTWPKQISIMSTLLLLPCQPSNMDRRPNSALNEVFLINSGNINNCNGNLDPLLCFKYYSYPFQMTKYHPQYLMKDTTTRYSFVFNIYLQRDLLFAFSCLLDLIILNKYNKIIKTTKKNWSIKLDFYVLHLFL